MSSLSDYLENALMDHVFQGGAAPYTAPTIYVGLSTVDPGDDAAGLAEPAGNGYARGAHATWNAAANRYVTNNGPIIFPEATGSWGTITHTVVFDAASAGNMLTYGSLAAPKTVAANNTVSLANGELEIGFRNWQVFFTSGGTFEVLAGHIIQGAVSGATAVIDSVTLSSGTWAGGDAAGYFRVTGVTGSFQSETLNVGANTDVAAVDGVLIGGISDYLAHKLLDLVFSGTAYTAPTIYTGFSTSFPGDDGTGITEPADNYARAWAANWSAASAGATDNDDNIDFAAPSGDWGVISWLTLMDALTAGNLLIFGKMNPSQNPGNGDTVRLEAGDFDISLS